MLHLKLEFVSEEIKVMKARSLGCSISLTLFTKFTRVSTGFQELQQKFSGRGIPIGEGPEDWIIVDDKVLTAQGNEDKEFMFKKLLEKYDKSVLKKN